MTLITACDSQYMPTIPAFSSSQSDENDDKNDDIEESKSHMEPRQITPEDRRTDTSNQKNLFAKSLRSDEDRLDRLERAVQDMRNEFNTVKPSIRRLMAIEGDIQNLIGELKALNEDPSLASPSNEWKTPARTQAAKKEIDAKPSPSPEKPKTAAAEFKPPQPSGDKGIYNVRIGEHPGKTRIVLDAGSKISFKTDIDNSEKIMVVELANTSWTTATSKSFANSPHIVSYKVETSGSDQLLIFQLKRDVKIGYQAEIGSVSGPGRRIVIDLSGT